jgi:hypothetical protein
MASKNPSITEREAKCGCVVRYAFNPDEDHRRRLHTPVEWAGRVCCDAHAHVDHFEHFRRLRAADQADADATNPGHGWRQVQEPGGGIRDVYRGDA